MNLKILTVPNPILRQKSQPVKTVDKKVLDFIHNLEDTLAKKRHPQGVGLSAPQVGKLWRIFSTFLPRRSSQSEGGPDPNIQDREDLAAKKVSRGLIIKTYINPQIIKLSKKLTLGPSQKPKAKSQKPFDKVQGKPILEGCLSIPSIYGPVWRHEWIKLRFTPGNLGNLGNQVIKSAQLPHFPHLPQSPNSLPEKTQVFSGFTARVIQHELDHLNGVLFTDRSVEQKLPLYEENASGKLQPIELV